MPDAAWSSPRHRSSTIRVRRSGPLRLGCPPVGSLPDAADAMRQQTDDPAGDGAPHDHDAVRTASAHRAAMERRAAASGHQRDRCRVGLCRSDRESLGRERHGNQHGGSRCHGQIFPHSPDTFLNSAPPANLRASPRGCKVCRDRAGSHRSTSTGPPGPGETRRPVPFRSGGRITRSWRVLHYGGVRLDFAAPFRQAPCGPGRCCVRSQRGGRP